MARKNYQVIAKDGAAWQRIHNELTSTTFNTTNIPDRPCLCKNETKHSETRGTYQLSVAEVEELRKNSDVAAVFVDPNYHPDTDQYDCTPCSLRFGKNVKNYRTLFSVANTEYTEVASSLMSVTGQLNQGTTNWVLVKTAHPNTPAMNYWQSMGFPLIYDYGVYPSVPADPASDDPLKGVTQSGANLITISNTGYYELEVACDGEYAAVWTTGASNYPKVPLVTTDDLTLTYNQAASTYPDNMWGKDRKDPRNQGIGYRIIQLGKLNPGTITLYFEIRNGSHGSPSKENWNNNPGCIAWKLRFLGNLNIKELGDAQAPSGTFVTHIPQDNPTSAEDNRTGYQILRCAEGTTTNPWTDTTTQISQDITYTNDGTDVDCIVLDNGVWTGHPEFVIDDQDPQHYITGNCLSRHARSGVLDILLDAPYYLDPEYFNANASYLETRWDGTIVPTENAARAWWLSASNRSNSFTDFGSIVVPSGYSRARHCGTDSLPPTNAEPSTRAGGNHGTPCGSLMYGKNHGWAFNSNKWSLSYPLGQADTPAGDACLDAIKVFHQYKPTNPKHGTKDPTVTNCSFTTGGGIGLGSINYDETGYGKYQYQPSGNSWNPANDVFFDQADYNNSSLPFRRWGNQPDFFRDIVYNFSTQWKPKWLNPGTTDASFPEFYAMREAANAGVVFVNSAGNDGMYRANDSDPNFWNARTFQATTGSCDSESENCGYMNRGSWPGSHNYRLNITNPSDYTSDNFQEIFVIGAMDDQLLGDMRKTTSSDALLKDTGTRNPFADSCEITANNLGNNCDVLSPYGDEREQSGDGRSYSNVGTLIDFFAPADSTLAATTYDYANALNYVRGTVPLPQHPSPRPHPAGASVYKYRDQYFNGTSAAAPVAAGLLACILQQNRGWTPNQLKTNTKNGIPNATNWYKGFAPNGPYDPKWLSAYSTKGLDVKIIKEWSGSKTTPNSSYETSNGLAPSRPNLNERFSITSSGTHTVKIIAIREFSSSDSGSPTELRIANGWYPVQIKKDTNSASDLANYKMRIKSGSNEQVLEISSNGGSSWTAFTITTVNGNFETDGSGRFWYYLNVDDDTGIPDIDDSSYNIQTNVSSVNEGATLITTITTTGVANGTTLYWSFSGTGISSSDFSSGSLTGSGSISNNSFNFTHVVANDGLTEGSETLQIKLFTDSARQLQVASKNVTIADTSGSSSYAISPSTTSVNEGSPLVYGVGTSNVANGTTLYWSLSGSGITAGDFSPSGLTGSGTINNSAFSVTRTIVADSTTEGPETITFKLFTDSARTNEVASNSSVTINDTSTTPAEPAYTLSVSPTNVNEGDTFTSTVTTTNVAQGTTIWWSAMGANVNNNDFSSGSMTGSGTVGFDGTFQFSHTLAEDALTEGTETIAVKIFTNSGYTQQVGDTVNVTVNDTSATSTYSVSTANSQVNEGDLGGITLTCTTTNVASGTTLYWNISGTNITSADIVGGVMQGSFNINNQGNAGWTIAFTDDATLEGTESATVKVFTDSARTIEVASTSFDILDTSLPAPTYQVLPNPTQGNEGTSFTTTISTTNVPDGTVLYWAMEDNDGTNTYITSDDFSSGALTGSGTVSGGTFSFTHTLANDTTTEAGEIIWIRLYGDSARLSELAYGNFEIADTSQSPTPAYSVVPEFTTTSEGLILNVNFITSNVPSGTTLYWKVVSVSGNVTAADIGGSMWDSETVQTPVPAQTYDGFSYAYAIAEDATTEGPEVFKIELYGTYLAGNPPTWQNLYATSPDITINDTSLTPGSPVYTITTNKSSYDEGEFVYVTMTTQNVTLPTDVYWQFSGSGITSNDFNEGTLEGSWYIDQTATNTISTKLRNDLDTEGNETLTIKAFSDSARTNQVGNTVNVTINDTSINPAVPAYNITPSVTQLDEGSTLTTTVTTQNVPDGTVLYWVVDQHTGTINAGDFSSGGMNGTGTVNNSTFTITHVIAGDALTEGEEKFAIKLYTESAYTNNVANTPVIEIFDTSQTASASYSLSTTASKFNEGDSFTTTVITTNVPNSTTLWWRLEGIDANDLSAGTVEGSGIITSNTFTFSHTLANDLAQEGDENLQIKLFTDSTRTNQVGNTLAITIKDTSQPGFNVIVTAPNNNEYILVGNDTDGTI